MTDILERPIFTYAPMQDGQRFIAIIRGVPMLFRGDTAIQARRLADDFRLVEALKLLGEKFPADLLDKVKAAQDRTDARAEAQKASK